jgi:hypothetical protein
MATLTLSIVIVTGGYGNSESLHSTEFFNLDSNSWTSGKNLLSIQSGHNHTWPQANRAEKSAGLIWLH